MSDFDNPFYIGQEVVCKNDNFKFADQLLIPKNKPHKDEILVVDDIKGRYLVFFKYNQDNINHFWDHTYFAPIDDIDNEVKNVMKQVNKMPVPEFDINSI